MIYLKTSTQNQPHKHTGVCAHPPLDRPSSRQGGRAYRAALAGLVKLGHSDRRAEAG